MFNATFPTLDGAGFAGVGTPGSGSRTFQLLAYAGAALGLAIKIRSSVWGHLPQLATDHAIIPDINAVDPKYVPRKIGGNRDYFAQRTLILGI